MSFLGTSLRTLAGRKLKAIIDKCTSNIFIGVLIGAFVTGIFQSSMATTLLVAGLISVGLMSLKQAVGIILGANIGTTITAFIVGLNITSYAPFIVLIGVVLLIFFKNQKIKNVGNVVLSFGLLFFGISLIDTSLSLLAEYQPFIDILLKFGDRPFLGLLLGSAGAIILQSSSAFVGIVQGLYSSTIGTGYTLQMVIPLLFGSAIGTSISCIIFSIGESIDAKRAVAIRVFVNVIGSLVFMAILSPFASAMTWLVKGVESKMQIAIVQIIFNIGTTILFLPFVNQLTKLATKVLPSRQTAGPAALEFDLTALDHNVMEISPSAALDIAKQQSLKMSEYAEESIILLGQYFESRDESLKTRVLQIEFAIDAFNIKLTEFFHRLDSVYLTEANMNDYAEILKTFRDIERISDHCENIANYFSEFFATNEEIHNEAKQDITDMLELTKKMIHIAINEYRTGIGLDLNELNNLENELDSLNKEARNRHVMRLATKQDQGNKFITVIFVDIISNIERIGDHCINISENVSEAKRSKIIPTPFDNN